MTGLYRALRRLSGVCEKGDLSPLSRLTDEERGKLLSLGAIAPVASPPLAVFPAWKQRAQALKQANILDAETLVLADLSVLSDALKEKPAIIEAWQRDALALMKLPVLTE